MKEILNNNNFLLFYPRKTKLIQNINFNKIFNHIEEDYDQKAKEIFNLINNFVKIHMSLIKC